MDGWLSLGKVAEREIALGAVGRFWQPDIQWYDVTGMTPEAFAAFTEPGWGRIAAKFTVLPYTSSRTPVSYEVRTATADPDSARRFARYWTVIRPFVGHIMRAALTAVRADAQQRSGPDGSSGSPGSRWRRRCDRRRRRGTGSRLGDHRAVRAGRLGVHGAGRAAAAGACVRSEQSVGNCHRPFLEAGRGGTKPARRRRRGSAGTYGYAKHGAGRRNVPRVDGARTSVNSRPIPPWRSRSMSVIESAPQIIPATSALTFAAAFAPPFAAIVSRSTSSAGIRTERRAPSPAPARHRTRGSDRRTARGSRGGREIVASSGCPSIL